MLFVGISEWQLRMFFFSWARLSHLLLHSLHFTVQSNLRWKYSSQYLKRLLPLVVPRMCVYLKWSPKLFSFPAAQPVTVCLCLPFLTRLSEFDGCRVQGTYRGRETACCTLVPQSATLTNCNETSAIRE